MIFTARQLQELHNGGNGQLVLPYRARLTPLAQDWLKQRKIAVGYSDAQLGPSLASSRQSPTETRAGGKLLWWCDSACGPAKAALLAQARDSNFVADELAVDAKAIVEACRMLATEIKNNRAAAAVMIFVVASVGA